MKRTKRRRTLSLFLVIVLIASLFGMSVQAVDNGEGANTEPIVSPSTPPESPSTPPDLPSTPPDLPSTPPDSPSTPPDSPSTPPDSPSTPPDSPTEDGFQKGLKAPEADALEFKEQTLTATVDGVLISVTGCFPAGVELHAIKSCNLGLGYAYCFYAYDISLWLGDTEYEITDTVSVSIIGLALPKEDICTFILQGDAVNKLNFESCDQTITFYTGCLSTFVVTLKSFDWKGCILGPNTVAVNDKISLLSTSKIATQEHSWSSGDTDIAEVTWSCENKAVIKGVSEGTVAITHTFEYWSGFLCFGSWKTATETVNITVYSRALIVTKAFYGLEPEEISSLMSKFTVTVKETCHAKCPLEYTKYLKEAAVIDGVYTWTFPCLDSGKYTVSESGFEVAGKRVVTQVNNDTNKTSTDVTVPVCSAAKVEFVNTYTPDTTPTGTLTVRKTFDGNGGNTPKDFAIVVNGTSYPLGEPTEGVYTWEITLPLGEEYSVSEENTDITGYTFDTDNSITEASGTLTSDNTVELKNIYWQNPGRVVTVRYKYKDPPEGIDLPELPNKGDPITVPYNSEYTSCEHPQLSGYVFDGWYVENPDPESTATVSNFFVKLFGGEDPNDKFKDGTPLTSDIVLYGIWIKTYAVTYTWAGGAPSDAILPAAESYEEGKPVKIAPAPTTSQSNWTFNGWKINGAPAADFTMGDSDVDIVGSWTQTIVYPPGVIYPDIPTSTEIPEESPPLNPSPSVSPDPGAEIPEEEVPHADAPVIPVDNNKPQTGDNSNLALMTILAALSSIGIGTVSIIGRRKKNSK